MMRHVALASLLVVGGCPDDSNCHDETCGPAHHQGGAGGSGEGASDAARDYCDCMLLSCHDTYHAEFGPDTDEPAARQACLDAAAALPEAGMDVDTGNFIECRQHYCELGEADESACPNTVGGVCL